MSTLEFLTFLRSRDVHIDLDGERLRINAPKDALVQELREQLTARKNEIINFLREKAVVLQRDHRPLARVPRGSTIPLSFAQQGVWFLDQLKPGSAAYVMPLSLRWRGLLDLGVLENSLTEIVRRHEALRTVVPSTDGVPSQVILSPSRVTVAVTDLGDQPLAEGENEARRLAAANALAPFDLTKGPLLRVRLVRLTPEDHVLLIAIHHIVFDGWSVGIFTRELATLYQLLRNGESCSLPELTVQYADFAQWQRLHLQGVVREKQLAYWKQELGGQLAALELPSDRPRSSSHSARGAKCSRALSKDLTTTLKILATKEGASLFMVLLAAFDVLLHRLSGQNDIVVGTPVAGRNRAEVENLIGFFTNTLVMRADFSQSQSFREVVAQVRTRTLNAYSHQDIPFEELVGILEPRRDLNRSPLFQVFFNHLNLEIPRLRIEGLSLEQFGEYDLESKFDLTLYVGENADALQLLLVYNKELFDEKRMTSLLDQYAGLLQNACLDPTQSVDRYSLLAVSNRENWPDPALPLDHRRHERVDERFVAQAGQHPNQLALEDANGRWTYAETEQLSKALADWLHSQEVREGDVVAIYGHRSASLVLAILGVLRAGAAFCILDPAYPVPRLLQNLRAARPKASLQLVGAGQPSDALKTVLEEIVNHRQMTLPLVPNLAQLRALAGNSIIFGKSNLDSLAYVTFSSGTTGHPKCILGTHQPLSHFVEWHCANFDLTKMDRFSLLSGLTHDPLLRDIFTPLWLGATLCIPSPGEMLSPGYLANWMHLSQITVSHLTPALGLLLAESSTTNLPVLRFAFFGGDLLTVKVSSDMQATAPAAQIVNFYGTTETPQVMAWHKIDQPRWPHADGDSTGEAAPIPIGRPIPDVQILILNRAGALAGAGELGEIYIRTPYLSLGYANDEALTRERFVSNPFTGDPRDRLYRTGDLGRFRPDGLVDIVGRADQQIKIRGYRIELGEVESALSACAGVRQAVVVAHADAPHSLRLIGYVVPEGGTPPSTAELRSHLGKVLPDYMIPTVFTWLEKMPLTPNGKIDRRALPVPDRDFARVGDGTFVAPRNHVETLMAKIWSEVLGVNQVGVFDHFFQLGGHSLTATKLIAKLNATFHVEIPLRQLFVDPTIAALAALIRYDGSIQSYHYIGGAYLWKRLVPAQPKGSQIPLFFVGGYTDPNDTWRILSYFIPHLGLDQPMYGFQPRWLDGKSDPYSSVKEVVNDYLTELRAFRPDGPYFLVGDCVGGIIALEMARELTRQGAEVGMLVMLDTERPTFLRDVMAHVRHYWRRGRRMISTLGQLVFSRYSVKKKLLREIVQRKTTALQPEKRGELADDRTYRLRTEFRRMLYRYRVKKYPGKAVLVINEHQYRIDKNMGWRGMTGGLEIHVTPGYHMTRFTTHSREITKVLSGCLERVRSATTKK